MSDDPNQTDDGTVTETERPDGAARAPDKAAEAETASVELPELDNERAEPDGESDPDADEQRFANDLEAVFDIPVHVSAVLGKTNIEVSQLLKLGEGAVVELDRKVGEAIDIFVNNRLVARGEVVLVEERLGVTMTEIIKGGTQS